MLSSLPPCPPPPLPTLLNVLRVCFHFVYEALLFVPLTSSLSLTSPQATCHTFLSRPPRVPPLLLSFHDFPPLHLHSGRPHSSTLCPANVIVLAARFSSPATSSSSPLSSHPFSRFLSSNPTLSLPPPPPPRDCCCPLPRLASSCSLLLFPPAPPPLPPH